MTTLYITHGDCRRHEMGSWHPECPERLDAIADHLLATGVLPQLIEREAPNAPPEAVTRVHAAHYVERLTQQVPAEGYYPIDPDTLMNPHTLAAAWRAAGAAVAAVDAVMGGDADTAFCAVRPPGHHAEPDKAMGFCFFNNVAIAARHALEAHGLSRVAVVDFDVHHGNGTEAALQGDDRILMCSFFQHPFYPFSGTRNPAPNMLNLPVSAYGDGGIVRPLVQDEWLPRLHAHRPQLILISAGFDAHREDDMGQLGLVEADYAWITEQIMAVAREHAQGRVVSCLEGGYALSALGRSVAAHIRALAGIG
ncbi:histone deacetylase family protein [Achromobacter sp. GG226]|uniref:histone deacetylase family protein n=1 Tax=Verticiella alkaliphila TaxID=2779529 RepID=UPI001C0DFC51|nr:histone deacetylase family protein [Verticiella sp. GG226]MBU4612717.1 histone deacetylase family protein [Verticiella sp. GG226]